MGDGVQRHTLVTRIDNASKTDSRRQWMQATVGLPNTMVEGSALNTCVQATVGLPNTPSTDTNDR